MPKVAKPAIVQREERIVKAFHHARIDKGWTVKHLAELCKMDAGNMSRVINHPMKVQLDTILMIASKLGIENIPI